MSHQANGRSHARKWLVYTFFVQVFATALFLKGFVLPRSVSERHSTSLHQAEGPAADTCRQAAEWYGDHTVVVVIIDALRYDMVVGDRRRFHSLGGTGWLLRSESPTTTAQRLKGMTTGSIPAFMEISTAFNSDEVRQDNLLLQLKEHGRTAAVLGDDTWVALFPPSSGYWDHHHVFPSFNVWDLDTVDNGIKDSIEDVFDADGLIRYSFNVLHFLGVDHAGHRYGPYHPEMDRKIRETDLFLSNLKKRLRTQPTEVTLLVLGDHGMTEDGQHGGGTDLELNSVLHVDVFGGAASRREPSPSIFATAIDQVDLVPTLSVLMSTAMPFNNLGVVSRELLNLACGRACDDEETELVRYASSLLCNAKQVHDGLVASLGGAVREHSPRFSDDMQRWEREAHEVFDWDAGRLKPGADLADARRVVQGMRDFISPAHEIARTEWAKMHPLYLYAAVGLSLAPTLYYFLSPAAQAWRRQESNSAGTAFFVLPLLLAAAMASNSYIVMEEQVVGYMAISALLLLAGVHQNLPCALGALLLRIMPHLMTRTHRRFGTHLLSASTPVHDLDGYDELVCVALLPLAIIYLHANSRYGNPERSITQRALQGALYLCVATSFIFKVVETDGGRGIGQDCAFASLAVCVLGWLCGMRDVWGISCLVAGPRAVPVWAVAKVVVGVVDTMPTRGAGQGVVMYLVTWFVFFCSGHQTVVSAIDFGSAFVGFSKLHHTLQGVMLVGFNTYAPLLLNHTRGTSLAVSCLLVTSGCMFAAAHHREHLMVWEVFAPRMLYACAVAPFVAARCWAAL
eukprot:TRINITY_DN2410_c0_g3_i2.p1 TRINITY_DN2410_c0_g3~~TRINITY_DN2410_c0_g3_i2.p1  ORF type:complete len:796 (+),score=186.23 TRINITY_DN2410_c0_g3_i2:1411-3798(+)